MRHSNFTSLLTCESVFLDQQFSFQLTGDGWPCREGCVAQLYTHLVCQMHACHVKNILIFITKIEQSSINLLVTVIDVFFPWSIPGEELQKQHSYHLWVYVIELHPNCQSNTFSSVQFIWSCATEEDHNACITWTKQLINDCFSKISMLTLKEECSSSGLKGKSQVLPNKTPSLLNRTE